MYKLASIALIIAPILLMSCAEDIPEPITMEELEELLSIPVELPERITGNDGAPMVLIPAGEFLMGSNNGGADEKPVHTVYLDSFYIDMYEVTNAQYRRFVQATGHKEPLGLTRVDGRLVDGFRPWSDRNFSRDSQPVVCVNWEDAKAYAEWAGKRLPTEAEWEKAARGELVGRQYTWGNTWSPPRGAGNFADEAAKNAVGNWLIAEGYDDGYIYPAPVGSFAPNSYGLYDMAGNVWDWCADWYDSGYYARSPESNPTGPNSGTARVHRGGSWHYGDHLRVTSRGYSRPQDAISDTGFRCVRDVAP
jgi:sulfatase modifying factor 1